MYPHQINMAPIETAREARKEWGCVGKKTP